MQTVIIKPLLLNDKTLANVDRLIYLGNIMSKDGDCSIDNNNTLELELSQLLHLLCGTHCLSVLSHVKIFQHFGVI